MFSNTFSTTLAAALLLASGVAAAPVTNHGDVVSTTVFVGDLNLASQTGAQIALRRVAAAASAICGGEPNLRDLDREARYRACTRAAIDGTVASLDRPLMTAMRTSQSVE